MLKKNGVWTAVSLSGISYDYVADFADFSETNKATAAATCGFALYPAYASYYTINSNKTITLTENTGYWGGSIVFFQDFPEKPTLNLEVTFLDKSFSQLEIYRHSSGAYFPMGINIGCGYTNSSYPNRLIINVNDVGIGSINPALIQSGINTATIKIGFIKNLNTPIGTVFKDSSGEELTQYLKRVKLA